MSSVSDFQTRWSRAFTLAERRAVVHSSQRPWEFAARPEVEEAYRRWRATSWLKGEAEFQAFLEDNGLDDLTFRSILGLHDEEIVQGLGDRRTWLFTVQRALRADPSNDLDPVPRVLEEPSFLRMVRPLLGEAIVKVRARLQSMARSSEAFEAHTLEDALCRQLPSLLRPQVLQSFTLELNVARLEGSLAGDSPKARYHSFLRRLEDPAVVRRILREYPVLTRLVVERVAAWADAGLELVQRFCADRLELRARLLGGRDPGPLVSLESGMGDQHAGGRSVTVLNFASGDKVLYKPRSLAVDGAFRDFLSWLEEETDGLGLRAPEVLDREEYGWMEFVEWRPSTADELRQFYERQGALIALTYVLNAVDLHYENLVAAGDCPVLVDLESLFHPAFPNDGPPPNPSERALDRSVIRMGLLPYISWARNDNRRGVDLSGLGAAQGQEAPFGVPTPEAVETDEMRFGRRRPILEGSLNHPSSEPPALVDFRDEIERGFRRTYHLLEANRHRLLATDGPLTAFRQVRVRAILRATSYYGRIQQETYHPDCLRDALDRERLLSALWVAARSQGAYRRIAVTESRALWRGDIPYFWTRVDDTHLRDSSGALFGDFFSESPWKALESRLRQLGEGDLERQSWVLRASIATTLQSQGREPSLAYVVQGPTRRLDGSTALEVATALGDRIAGLALWDDEKTFASWIGLTLGLDENSWILAPSQADLYSGLPGIAFFLAALGQATRCERYDVLARGAVATTETIVQGIDDSSLPGAFQGLGGWIYVLAHLGSLWRDDELLDRAERLVPFLARSVERDETFDLISGSAGGLLALLALHEVRPSRSIEHVARLCGDRLITAAVEVDGGVAWPWERGVSPLTGLSHGASGCGLALLLLGALTGARRYHDAGLQAFAYERTLFSQAQGNWPDLRWEDRSDYAVAWCHGAVGIGLARLRAWPVVRDGETRGEILTAARTTLATGLEMNHSLCHGSLGNLELVRGAAELFPDPEMRAAADEFSRGILEQIRRWGWQTAAPFGLETPSLMIGLAGIGYGLLRIHDSERFPSVLTMEPPHVRSG